MLWALVVVNSIGYQMVDELSTRNLQLETEIGWT